MHSRPFTFLKSTLTDIHEYKVGELKDMTTRKKKKNPTKKSTYWIVSLQKIVRRDHISNLLSWTWVSNSWVFQNLLHRPKTWLLFPRRLRKEIRLTFEKDNCQKKTGLALLKNISDLNISLRDERPRLVSSTPWEDWSLQFLHPNRASQPQVYGTA